MEESFSVPQVAKLLNVSRQQIYRLIQSDRLKAWNVGIGNTRKRLRINKKELEAFQENGQ